MYIGHRTEILKADVSSVSPSSERIDEGLMLETSAFRISVRWPIYIVNSVDKTKFLDTKNSCIGDYLRTRDIITGKTAYLTLNRY